MAEEELARAGRQLEGVSDSGKLVCVEKPESCESRRDRVGTRARVEEDPRLDVEMVTPARLGKPGAAQPGESVDAPAELEICFAIVEEPVAGVGGDDVRQRCSTQAVGDRQKRTKIQRGALDCLGDDSQGERRAARDTRQAPRVESVVRVRARPAASASPSLEGLRRVECGGDVSVVLRDLRGSDADPRHETDRGMAMRWRESTRPPFFRLYPLEAWKIWAQRLALVPSSALVAPCEGKLQAPIPVIVAQGWSWRAMG